jgi:hypothetical protein
LYCFVQAEIVEYLLEHHARLDLCEEYHITPVFAAAQYGYPKCLHLMLKAAVKRGEQPSEPSFIQMALIR